MSEFKLKDDQFAFAAFSLYLRVSTLEALVLDHKVPRVPSEEYHLLINKT